MHHALDSAGQDIGFAAYCPTDVISFLATDTRCSSYAIITAGTVWRKFMWRMGTPKVDFALIEGCRPNMNDRG
jgi:hypothetical protein